MQGDAVEAVTSMFDAFARRDIEATLSQLDPDVTLTVTATARLAGRSEPYSGHDGVRQYFEDVETVWSELELEPADIRAVAGSVVIFGRVRGRRAVRGQSVAVLEDSMPGIPEPGGYIDQGVVWTWKLEHGKIVAGSVHLAA